MKRAVVFLFVGVVLFGVCGAQSVHAQNISQKIVGTWVDQTGRTWVFNADGTATLPGINNNQTYAVSDTKLFTYSRAMKTTDVYNISVSSDGKTIFLDFLYEKDYGDHGGYWLTKK